MENMENNVVAMENAAAEVTNGTTFGQKVAGGFLGACTVVGAVVIAKKAIKGIKGLIGKTKVKKAGKQTQNVIVEAECEEVTE